MCKTKALLLYLFMNMYNTCIMSHSSVDDLMDCFIAFMPVLQHLHFLLFKGVDCEMVYVQMLFLLFKGCLCGLYYCFCASCTCISPLFKFSSVQFKMVFMRSKKSICTPVQFKMVFMHSKKPICTQVQFSSVQDGIYALKTPQLMRSTLSLIL